ncbi:MAG: hypothetical protein E7355_03930 [Clostridiales bacterium]|nr:hypothetical protein [Clostridiales bacterium]
MFFPLRERLELQGLMPERALLRLRRAGIPLYDVRKTKSDTLRITVKKKDAATVFSVYPKGGDYATAYAPYVVRSVGYIGVGRYWETLKRRIGFSLGACVFCLSTMFFDGCIFGVEFTASSVYARETFALLDEYGIRPFSRYKAGNEEKICAKLLALDGVEFCSIKKSGTRLLVDMRLGETPKTTFTKGAMKARHTGNVLAITALKGSVEKNVGDSVNAGDTLVGDWIETADGERRRVDVMARVSIACSYECVVAATDEKEAFAVAYMQAAIGEEDVITYTQSVAIENGYFTRIEYTAIERMNV